MATENGETRRWLVRDVLIGGLLVAIIGGLTVAFLTGDFPPPKQEPISSPIAQSILAPCPSTEEAQQLTNLNITPHFTRGISWEPCQWTWHSNGPETANLSLPSDWAATVTLKGEGFSRVYLGEQNLNLEVVGFTLRFLPSYPEDHWVRDPQQLWQKEWDYSWPISPTCPGNIQVEMTSKQIDACNP
jgi:hypothetical protein